jgi:hypothetical protein
MYSAVESNRLDGLLRPSYIGLLPDYHGADRGAVHRDDHHGRAVLHALAASSPFILYR